MHCTTTYCGRLRRGFTFPLTIEYLIQQATILLPPMNAFLGRYELYNEENNFNSVQPLKTPCTYCATPFVFQMLES